jgi:hypothetical protein
MTSIDLRLLRASINFDNQTTVYDNLAIQAVGSKTASPTENTTTVKIANIKNETLNNILTNSSPFVKESDRVRQSIKIEAGRVSTGLSTVYIGDITQVSMTQKPDVWAVIKASTAQFFKGDYVTVVGGQVNTVNSISEIVAGQLGLSLKFEADDKEITNYSFSGSPTKQMRLIEQLGTYDAYIDDDELVVKNLKQPINGGIKLINKDTGLVGIPEITEFGVKVTFLYDSTVKTGSRVRIESTIYEDINGEYIVSKLDFNLTNRNTPFYYIAECERF